MMTAPTRKAKISASERKQKLPPPPLDTSRVASIILGGGQGTRLFPLTHHRCKPATPFGGRYRLIDVPVSNSINSGIRKIFVVTQFLSSRLHQHILKNYRFDDYSSGFVELLAAEQKPMSTMWFQGTADAVRQNIEYFAETPVDYFLILSGDQLYNLDFQQMLRFAQKRDADLVVATLPVGQHDASRMGIMQIDKQSRIAKFCEKPKEASTLAELETSQDCLERAGLTNTEGRPYLASMGIYLFKREALFDILKNDVREDFGKHLIPTMVDAGRAWAFAYDGYWEDIGTIESFHQANLALTKKTPAFDWYAQSNALFGSQEHLPGPKIDDCHIRQSILCEGSIIEADEITNSIIGTRSIIEQGTIVRDSYLMGNDFYEPPIRGHNQLPDDLIIETDCIIQNAIIDRNVHIGKGVQLINKDKVTHYNGDKIYIRDGVTVVSRGAHIPDHFIL